MKVLMANTEFNRGGAAQIARTLFQSLNQKSEFECYFIFSSIFNSYYWFIRIWKLFFDSKIRNILLEENLIHLNNLCGYYLYIF